MLIESISGVRGTVPDSLNNEVVALYAGAFHQFCPKGDIVVGRDSRSSGIHFLTEIVETLMASGRTVNQCGIVPTPTLQYVVDDTEAVGGIIVTASHNPAEWNGLKFFGADGCYLNSSQVKKLMQLKSVDFPELSDGEGKHIQMNDAIDRHITRTCDVSWIDLDAIRQRKFKVAVDAVNGAATVALPELLDKLGCEVVAINCEPTGEFTRGTEPLPENLSDLSQLVQQENCHVGFATDPDADRLAVIDEKGKPVGEEYTLVLALDGFLSTIDSSETVVTNLSTTMAVDKVAERYGAQVTRSAVGEINVVEMMKKTGASIGGEGNGGVILKEVHLGRDSLVAGASILHRLAQTDSNLSEVMNKLPKFEIVKYKVSIERIDGDTLFQKISNSFDSALIDERDGLKLTWNDRWIHVRRSNTEPIMRIYTEASSEKEARELAEKVKLIIQS